METEFHSLRCTYEQYGHLENQKDFALAIRDKVRMTGILFSARKTGRTVREVWIESGDLIYKSLFHNELGVLATQTGVG